MNEQTLRDVIEEIVKKELRERQEKEVDEDRVIEVECEECGETIERRKSQLKENNHTFCSKNCQGSFYSGEGSVATERKEYVKLSDGMVSVSDFHLREAELDPEKDYKVKRMPGNKMRRPVTKGEIVLIFKEDGGE